MSDKKLLPFSDGGIERLSWFFDRAEAKYLEGKIESLPVMEAAQLMKDCIAAARKYVDNVKAIERIIGS